MLEKCNLLRIMTAVLGPIKKFSLLSLPASEFPAASNFFVFIICLIPYENKVYKFISVVVMNYKFWRVLWVSSKHMFLLAFLLTLGPVIRQFVEVVTSLLKWLTTQ